LSQPIHSIFHALSQSIHTTFHALSQSIHYSSCFATNWTARKKMGDITLTGGGYKKCIATQRCDVAFVRHMVLYRESVVDVVARLRAGRSRVRMPAGARYFSLLQKETDFGVQPADYSMGTFLSFSWCKEAGVWGWHSPSSRAEFRNEWSYYLLSPCIPLWPAYGQLHFTFL
jgi:hypothetical protein